MKPPAIRRFIMTMNGQAAVLLQDELIRKLLFPYQSARRIRIHRSSDPAVRIMTDYGMSEQCRGFRQVFDFIASSLCAVLAARRKLGDAGRYAFRKAKRSALIVPDSVFNCNKSF
jgi:hypothetical protein